MSETEKPTSSETGPETPQAGAKPVPTVSDIFGQVTWLMTQSKGHRNFFVSDLEWMAMPPLLHRQFRIFPGKDQPLGVALWAKVSDEVAARLSSGQNRLAPGDWNSGENFWLVELIAPFGHQDKMLADLQQTVFAGKQVNMHMTGQDGKRSVTTLDQVLANARAAAEAAAAQQSASNGDAQPVN